MPSFQRPLDARREYEDKVIDDVVRMEALPQAAANEHGDQGPQFDFGQRNEAKRRMRPSHRTTGVPFVDAATLPVRRDTACRGQRYPRAPAQEGLTPAEVEIDSSRQPARGTGCR